MALCQKVTEGLGSVAAPASHPPGGPALGLGAAQKHPGRRVQAPVHTVGPCTGTCCLLRCLLCCLTPLKVSRVLQSSWRTLCPGLLRPCPRHRDALLEYVTGCCHLPWRSHAVHDGEWGSVQRAHWNWGPRGKSGLPDGREVLGESFPGEEAAPHAWRG